MAGQKRCGRTRDYRCEKKKGNIGKRKKIEKTKLTSKSNLYIHVYIYTYIACSTPPHRQKLN